LRILEETKDGGDDDEEIAGADKGVRRLGGDKEGGDDDEEIAGADKGVRRLDGDKEGGDDDEEIAGADKGVRRLDGDKEGGDDDEEIAGADKGVRRLDGDKKSDKKVEKPKKKSRELQTETVTVQTGPVDIINESNVGNLMSFGSNPAMQLEGNLMFMLQLYARVKGFIENHKAFMLEEETTKKAEESKKRSVKMISGHKKLSKEKPNLKNKKNQRVLLSNEAELEREAAQIVRMEKRLRQKLLSLVERSKKTFDGYRRLQVVQNNQVKFALDKDIKTTMSQDINKPKGIKETKVTKSGVESRNPDARLKRLVPQDEVAFKQGFLYVTSSLFILLAIFFVN